MKKIFFFVVFLLFNFLNVDAQHSFEVNKRKNAQLMVDGKPFTGDRDIILVHYKQHAGIAQSNDSTVVYLTDFAVRRPVKGSRLVVTWKKTPSGDWQMCKAPEWVPIEGTYVSSK